MIQPFADVSAAETSQTQDPANTLASHSVLQVLTTYLCFSRSDCDYA